MNDLSTFYLLDVAEGTDISRVREAPAGPPHSRGGILDVRIPGAEAGGGARLKLAAEELGVMSSILKKNRRMDLFLASFENKNVYFIEHKTKSEALTDFFLLQTNKKTP